ncbi:glycosyltransferase [Terrabacter sp. BE26]|uniref:glycosyltransferase n=1 Tax=Terrabacter sp. BE26 TaxID=2898152 RepID=UPI0035BE7A8F
MRILHVNKFLYRRGGAEGYMLDVAALQRAAGHEVGLFGMDHPENDAPQPLRDTFPPFVELEPAPRGLAGIRASARMVWSGSSARGIERAIREFKPDLVHCHNIYHQLSPSVLRPVARAGIPIVMTLHDYKLACPSYQMLDHGRPCDECVGRGTWHAAVKRCKNGSVTGSVLLAVESGIHRTLDAYGPVDAFISPSRFLASVMVRQGIAHDRVHVVNNFTRIPEGTDPPQAGEGFVVAGRLSPEKGVDTAIRAIGRLSGASVLHVAGDGPERPGLEDLANQVAPGRVVFHGRLGADELAALVRRSRALLVPSRWYENQPMTVLEAFAASTPVVVTDLGGMPELVDPGVEGLVVRANDERLLARALARLEADPDEAVAMGMAGRRRLEQDFAAPAHLTRLGAVYEQARTTAARSAKHPVLQRSGGSL